MGAGTTGGDWRRVTWHCGPVEEWVGYRRTTPPKVRRCLRARNNASVTESGSPSTTRALPLKPGEKPDEAASKPQAMTEVRRCLRTRAGHLGNREADSRRLQARRALYRQNRYAKPMELPPNLEAVYLGKFKRALAWAFCRRPTREFWQ